MIVKVKEPVPAEFNLLREHQLLFTYLHLAADEALTRCLIARKVQAVAYETVQLPNRSLPLLTPMSEVAGRMSVQVGAHYLQRNEGGYGVLLGGVPGVEPAKVVVIGGGVVGTNAAQIALGMGAQVSIVDLNVDRLRQLELLLHGRLTTLVSNRTTIGDAVAEADLVIGGVLLPGARAPKLVTRAMIERMRTGSVVVDVAIDQGGCIETAKPTTHSKPTYEVSGVTHYCVTNMPGAVPRTSTIALSNVTLPYALALADNGLVAAAACGPGAGARNQRAEWTYCVSGGGRRLRSAILTLAIGCLSRGLVGSLVVQACGSRGMQSEESLTTTVTTFIDDLTTERGFSVNTVAAYRNDLSQFADYLSSPPAEDQLAPLETWNGLTSDHLGRYLSYMYGRQYAASTVARKTAALKSFCHYLTNTGVLREDPSHSLASPRVDRYVPRAISEHEVGLLLAEPRQAATSRRPDALARSCDDRDALFIRDARQRAGGTGYRRCRFSRKPGCLSGQGGPPSTGALAGAGTRSDR